MAMIPHICDRPCEHNWGGNCTFFNGDMYYLDCFKNATMFKKREQ